MEKEKSIELRSRVLETRRVNWKHFSYIQEKCFKNLSQEAKNKLRESILSNSFTQPFYVWQNPIDGVLYCLDGRHRTLILEELEGEGYKVPMLLDATFIHCNDIKEAAQLVLIYSSMYAKVTEAGLVDFIEMYELNQEQLSEVINLPDLNWDKFVGDQDTDFSLKNFELDPDA